MEYTLVNKKDGLYVDVGGELKKVIRAFESFTGWYWFAFEAEKVPAEDAIDGKEDIFFFGLVQGFEEEIGSFSYNELKALMPYKVWELKGNGLLCAGRRH